MTNTNMTLDDILSGNYQCEFPDNREAITELERLIAIKKLNIAK